ncbi:Ig-like domain-containing protein [Microbispora catharanthi]|uniref:Ig-like domain-containing protein n=1 Tax=Microbispora catharanthi TaxID=1712871 RepID=UPI001378FDD4|nr:Ig-like domain-containing protein [Microbispora catharanthi]
MLTATQAQAAADATLRTHGHQAAVAPCVRHGQANYPVEYYWKNVVGWRLGNGSISVTTSPSLWGGQIAPGGTFTLTLRHHTAQWPALVSTYTTMWDLSSLLASATVVGPVSNGTLSGNTLSIRSPGTKTDPGPTVITFRVNPGTVGRSMTIRPSGISSVIAFPGQLGNNTAAPPIQIVSGQTISPTKAADDTASTTENTAVTVPVLANDTGASPTISGVTQPAYGNVTISGDKLIYTPDKDRAGTDTFTYTIDTACGTSTATVAVAVACTREPVNLVNGSFETPAVSRYDWNIPDASTNPGVGWRTTASDRKLEFWNSSSGVPAADGQQFAELNANERSTLYQDVPTVPGTVMTWSLYHRGRAGTDVMRVLVGAPGATTAQTPDGATSPDISDGNTAWGHYTGTYVVPAGQTVTRFAFESVSAAGGNPAIGNFLDGVVFKTPSCLPMSGEATSKNGN